MDTKRTQQLFLLSSFLIPTFFFTNYVLNQFYIQGSGLLDVGWFTYMITETTSWPIQNPEAIGGTFFSTHFSLFFYVLSYIHQYVLFFMPGPVFYSAFIGSMYGLISLSVFLVGLKLIPKISIQYLYALLFTSILSSMNGAALGLIGFPHIEIAIPALILLFFSLYITDKKILSFVVFTFLLTIREDAGFHVFALIMTTGILILIIKRNVKAIDLTLLGLAIIGLSYSIFAMYIQKIYFPGDNALERVYLGNPHFIHITCSFLSERLSFFFLNREYIYVPMLMTIILSLYTKNIILLSSLISSLPWFLLSLIAINVMPGSFSNYYAFPFILLGGWPIFAFYIAKKFAVEQSDYFKNTVISILFITGTSILLFPGNSGNVDHKPWKNFIFFDYGKIIGTEGFIKYFVANKAQFGNIIFDEPLSALFVKNLSKDEYGFLNVFPENIQNNADTILYYDTKRALNSSSVETMRNILWKNNLNNIYTVPNSNIILATKYNIPETSYLKVYKKPLLFWNGSDLPNNEDVGKNTKDNEKVSLGQKAGFLTYGPYVMLLPGKYKFKIEYLSKVSKNTVIGYWDAGIATPTGMKELTKGSLLGTDGKVEYIVGDINITDTIKNNKIEIRNFYNGTGDLTIKSLTITRIQ